MRDGPPAAGARTVLAVALALLGPVVLLAPALALAAPSGAPTQAAALFDDDGGQALFPGTALLTPGAGQQACLTVGTDGASGVDQVVMSAQGVSGTIAGDLVVGVEVGSGASGRDCSSFVGASVWSGTLAELGAASATGGVPTGWRPSGRSAASFRISVRVAARMGSQDSGRSAGAELQWHLTQGDVAGAPAPGPSLPTPVPAPPITAPTAVPSVPLPTALPAAPLPTALPAAPLPTALPAAPLPALPAEPAAPIPSASAPTVPDPDLPQPADPTVVVPGQPDDAPTGLDPAAVPTTADRSAPTDPPIERAAPDAGADGPASAPSAAAPQGAATRPPAPGAAAQSPPDLVLAAPGRLARTARAVSHTLVALLGDPQYPVAAMAVALGFLLLQDRLDRGDPKLMQAARSRRDTELVFPEPGVLS